MRRMRRRAPYERDVADNSTGREPRTTRSRAAVIAASGRTAPCPQPARPARGHGPPQHGPPAARTPHHHPPSAGPEAVPGRTAPACQLVRADAVPPGNTGYRRPRFRRPGDGPCRQTVRPTTTGTYRPRFDVAGNLGRIRHRKTRLPPASQPGIPNKGIKRKTRCQHRVRSTAIKPASRLHRSREAQIKGSNGRRSGTPPTPPTPH